jgi:hypothetical protein
MLGHVARRKYVGIVCSSELIDNNSIIYMKAGAAPSSALGTAPAPMQMRSASVLRPSDVYKNSWMPSYRYSGRYSRIAGRLLCCDVVLQHVCRLL